MTIVITNDDGPLDSIHSQYVSPFINHYLENYSSSSTYYSEKLLLSVPSEQKSWISKAHFANKDISIRFVYSSSKTPYDNENRIGPFSKPLPLDLHPGIAKTKFPPISDSELSTIHKLHNPKNLSLSTYKSHYDIEWVLVSGTPATATDIGIHHLLSTPESVTKLISGPNVGRNVSRPYITSSGTIGATMESYITSGGAINGIGLSWAYFDNLKNVNVKGMKSASEWSWKVIFQLNRKGIEAEVYAVNVPILNDGLKEDTKVVLAPIQENTWKSLYEGTKEDGEGIVFKWNPDFNCNREKMVQGMKENQQNDGSLIEAKNITITPLLASFAVKLDKEDYGKEVNLADDIKNLHVDEAASQVAVILNNEVPYVNELWKGLLSKHSHKIDIYNSLEEFEKAAISYQKVFHIAEYEELLHSKGMQQSKEYFQNSYTFRKSLIRKHYLLKTIQYFVAKNPNSILKTNFPESFHIDLDYAEFLDEALDDNWDLRQELEASESTPQWWIMKPSMSDKGQGIRLFKTISQLQKIFDFFDDDENGEGYNGIIINQLRHFIIQKLLMNPLIIDGRKFHIRCYVVCVGDLQVFVYDRMLCLFSLSKYLPPADYIKDDEDILANEGFLSQHLTNTCQQSQISSETVQELQHVFDTQEKDKITNGIHDIVKDLFMAAKQDNYNFQAMNNAYEIFGLDFLVDEDHQPHLLEVNSYPDFKQTGDHLSGLINELFENVMNVSVLPNLINEGSLPADNNLTKVLEVQHESRNW